MKFALLVVFACIAASAVAYSAPAPEGEIECVACEFLVGKIEGYLASNATVSEIEAELAKVCADLPGSISGVCTDIVENYLPAIIEALENKEDPDQVCSQVGLCTSSVAAPEDECTVCTIIVGEVYSLLSNNATETEIISALTAACALLPSSDQAICNNLVQNYIPQIISMIEQDFTPTEICTEIGLCTSSAAGKVAAPQDMCAICEIVVNELESLLAANATESEIESALDKICAALPGSFGASCTSLVSTFLPELITELENGFPATIVCQKVGVCSSLSSPQDSCATCQIVVNAVEEYIAANKTEAFIITELEKICAILPGSFSSVCDSLVEQDVGAIIAAVEAKETPEVVCTKLGKCSSARMAAPAASPQICEACEVVVAFAEKFAAGKTLNNTEIVDELKTLCADIPAITAECDLVVGVFGLSILEAIESGTPAATVCTSMHLCTSSSKAIPAISISRARKL